MSKPSYITTSIPYVNAPPHVGFALELVQADVLARYRRLTGSDVRFQSGTDENAFKNVTSARALGVPVQQLVDENSARFRSLCSVLDISIDCFIRTTERAHRDAVSGFLSRLQADDLYRREYRGRYCVGCEDFYLEGDLADGCCPEHALPALEIAEENVFFRLSRYETALRELIATRRIRIIPESREREVLRFIDGGLADISVSRDASRCEHWGIPFPGDAAQVVYVWIDALINYLSGLGFPDDANVDYYWRDGITSHVIGKNVWKFHAVYWPALLLSAGVAPPDQIVVHGFLTNEGRKISKSAGDAVDPAEYVARFGSDAVRYFLLRHTRPFDDSDFSVARLEQAYQADLANGLGNVVSRVTALCEAAGPLGCSSSDCPPAPPSYHEALDEFRFDRAVSSLWNEVTRLNRDITLAKPWESLTAGDTTNARQTVSPFVDRLAAIGYWLEPFLPAASAKIREQLSETRIVKRDPLFPRLRREESSA